MDMISKQRDIPDEMKQLAFRSNRFPFTLVEGFSWNKHHSLAIPSHVQYVIRSVHSLGLSTNAFFLCINLE